MKTINRFEFVMPKMSWEKPIEEEMLEWLKHMTSQMERTANLHESKSIREGASNMATAYRTAGEHLIKEIRLRQKMGVSSNQSGSSTDVTQE